MESDVMRITPLIEPGRSHVIEMALDCGHKVRRYDPGAHLRPSLVDCCKCDRNVPAEIGAGVEV